MGSARALNKRGATELPPSCLVRDVQAAGGAWQVTLVGSFDAEVVLDTAVRIDSFYLDPDDPDKLTYQALAPSNLDTSVGLRFCTRVEADNGDDKASP